MSNRRPGASLGARVAELTGFIQLLIERFKASEATFADRLEVQPREFAVLYTLAREGPMIGRDVAARFGVPVSTLTGLVDRMEQKGLVRRVPNRRDRRSIELEATPAGTLALREHDRVLETMARGMLVPLAERDQESMMTLLRRVAAALAEPAAPIATRVRPTVRNSKHSNIKRKGASR